MYNLIEAVIHARPGRAVALVVVVANGQARVAWMEIGSNCGPEHTTCSRRDGCLLGSLMPPTGSSNRQTVTI